MSRLDPRNESVETDRSASRPRRRGVTDGRVEARLGVSVLTHNASASIDEVIDGLQRQTLPPSKVLIVDNGSDDDTVERCRAQGLSVRCAPNRGVGAGHAAALDELFADGSLDHVLLLEHDSVLTRTCIENLLVAVDALSQEERTIGVIACEVVHPVENARRIEQVETTKALPALAPARRITFNGLMIDWEAFAAVGHPRSDFFVGQEDSDLFRRLRRAGVPVRTAPYALVAHSGKGRLRRGEPIATSRDSYSARNTTYRDAYIDGRPMRAVARVIGATLRATVRPSPTDVDALDAVRRGIAGILGPLRLRTNDR